jgi:uncharacterized membrane protein YqiK
MNLVVLFVMGVVLLVAVVAVLVLLRLFYHKLKPGQALVVTSAGGSRQRVTFTGAVVIPIVQRGDLIDITVRTIEVELDGDRAAVSKDGVRVGVKVFFYIRVNHTREDVLMVARNFGCERACDPEAVRAYFHPKLVESVRTVTRQFEFEALQSDRERYHDQLIQFIGRDLNGYVLDDAAVERVDRAAHNQPESGPFR